MTAWETLGIEPTSEISAIKRAYAARLKIIRPDEDPHGFQALREARDQALNMAPYVNLDEAEYKADSDDDWDVDWDETEGGSEEDETENPSGISTGNITNHNKESPENLLQEEAPKTTAFIDMRSNKTSPPGSENYTSTDEPPPATANNQPDEKPDIAYITLHDDTNAEPQIEAAIQEVSNGDEGETAFIDLSTYEEIDSELEQLCGPWNKWSAPEWETFIRDVREQSFELSKYAERKILFALSEALVPLTPRNDEERTSLTSILALLDGEFGWRQNDRRVYHVLGDERAEQLMDYIRDRLSNPDELPERQFYDALGFPLLSEQDFIDYLGRKDTSYQRYYQYCRDNGNEYRKSWSWPGFLLCPLWLAHRCNDGIEALIGIIYTIGLVTLIFAYNNSSYIWFIAAIALLATLHLIVGLYGKRIVLSTMATALTELESDQTISENDRLERLKKLGQGGLKAISDLILGNIGIAIILIVILAIFTGG